MNGEKRLNEFLSSIDEWIDCHNIAKIEKNENIEHILNLKYDDITALTEEQCFGYSYELYAHSEYIERIKEREKSILEWADSSIWYIICSAVNQYGDKYTKWQEKYFLAVKENPLASDILKVKNHAQARINSISNYSDNLKKMAELLNNIAKRKTQWH
jgi:hypothetical protein